MQMVQSVIQGVNGRLVLLLNDAREVFGSGVPHDEFLLGGGDECGVFVHALRVKPSGRHVNSYSDDAEDF